MTRARHTGPCGAARWARHRLPPRNKPLPTQPPTHTSNFLPQPTTTIHPTHSQHTAPTSITPPCLSPPLSLPSNASLLTAPMELTLRTYHNHNHLHPNPHQCLPVPYKCTYLILLNYSVGLHRFLPFQVDLFLVCAAMDGLQGYWPGH